MSVLYHCIFLKGFSHSSDYPILILFPLCLVPGSLDMEFYFIIDDSFNYFLNVLYHNLDKKLKTKLFNISSLFDK